MYRLALSAGALLVGLGLTGLTAALAAVTPPQEGVFQERKEFIPYRKYVEVGGKVVGVLVSEAQPVLTTEGRSGPPDELCFSQNGGSYRWIYVPAMGQGGIRGLQVPVANGQKVVFDSLDLATPKTVGHIAVLKPFTLVELQVNNGLGSPANDSFVATQIKPLDGSKEYPLQVTQVIDQVKQDYKKYAQGLAKDLEAAMSAAQKKTLGNDKTTGPREQSELMYVTWMTKDQTLQVRFRTKVTDGSYTFVEGGAGRPVPLPLPPNKKFPPPPGAGGPAPAPGAGGPAPGGAGPQIAQPGRFRIKVGKSFGVEFGRAYVVNKEGKVIQTLRLPFESFEQTFAPLPGALRPGGPFGLPPRPVIKGD